MKSEYLLKNIGSVDDKYVNELYTEMYASSRRRKKGVSWGALAASIAVIVCGTASMLAGIGNVEEGSMTIGSNRSEIAMARNTVVMLDVNPSISMMVNDRGVVVEVTAENGEAEKLSDELNIVGDDYDTAITETVAVLQKHGYITQLKNSMLITVLDSDSERAEAIRSELVETVCTYADGIDYGLSILSQIMQYDGKLSDMAQEYSMSDGRALLLEKICDKYTDFDFAKLAENNIQTINQMFEYTELPDLLYRVGTAAGVVPSEYIDELDLEELDYDDLLSFTSAVSDFYDKLCEYYDMSDVAKNIGYVFEIVEASNADGDKLWALFVESLNGTHGAIINRGESSISDWFTPDTVNDVYDFVKVIVDAA